VLLVLLVRPCSLHNSNRLLKGENTLSNAAAILLYFCFAASLAWNYRRPARSAGSSFGFCADLPRRMEKMKMVPPQNWIKGQSLSPASTLALTINVSSCPFLIIPAYFLIRALRALKLAALLTGAGAAV